MNEGRNFKGIWIPKKIYLDDRLNALDKIILVEIDSLDNESGCYASNDYLASFCQCSTTKVSNSISKLKQLGYVESTVFDGRKRCIHVKLEGRLTNSDRQTYKNCKADLQNLKDNNIINNKENNNVYTYNESDENIHKFGEYGRIKLTGKQYYRLCEQFGEEFIKQQIDKLDEYVQSNNNKNKYSDFNLVLRKSIRENWFKDKPIKQNQGIKRIESKPTWFEQKIEEEQATEEEIRALEELMKRR